MRKDEFMQGCDWVAGINAADSDRDKPDIQPDSYEMPLACERRRHGRRGLLVTGGERQLAMIVVTVSFRLSFCTQFVESAELAIASCCDRGRGDVSGVVRSVWRDDFPENASTGQSRCGQCPKNGGGMLS